jgi:hypothetical protein
MALLFFACVLSGFVYFDEGFGLQAFSTQMVKGRQSQVLK